ncbi:MAG: class I SAM-dependent DNA methyltransferase [Bacteroides sp.]|nr:class I SAM-dependent DNA methyltransferase [Fermentimonas sp.]MDD4721098.1 class I SAM-dependent DNA methyltransferase [Bacteroides sp.]
MITGEIRNNIDAIWNTFWTSGITNSITVLEQMTYLFFIKILDDAQLKQEGTASVFGTVVEDPTFPEGNWTNPQTGSTVPYQNLRWNKFKDFDPQTMLTTVRDDIFVFIKNLSSGKNSSYSTYMKDATFLIPNERTLTKVVDGINSLDMEDRDTMGDVYEYILGKMASSGTNGQFRTPRHIIRMMTELMKPTLNDTVCDPAMGSAGFIVESARYISENFSKELLKTENANHYKNTMFHGFDTDQTMLRIGAMNMMLHAVENPNIEWRDSLSDDNKDSNKYTLIMANPPFTGSLDYEVVEKSLLTLAKTKKTELLFLALFIRSLELGGRCASIVPDGVLFGTSNAHKAIRRELVENQTLQAVISMPSGVFKPYAGVSTAILIFTKTNAGGTSDVWFYDMKADGYSLDDKRTEIKENDIPDIISRFHSLDKEKERTRKEQSFLVPKADIVANDYDLSINKYKEVERVKVVYDDPEVVLGRLENLQNQLAEAMVEYKTIVKKTSD